MARTQLRDIRKKLPLRVLSPEDWEHWTTRGYVVVRQAVSADNVERLTRALWEFEDMVPGDPATWYADRTDNQRLPGHSGLVEIYNHQAMWDNRQTQRVYDAFVDIWDTTGLWVVIDFANVNPPNRGTRAFEGFVHWDVDTSRRPLPISCQGVLSLSEGNEEIGGFQCVPGIFEKLDAWLEEQPPDRDPMTPDITGYAIETLRVDPGDLIIFNSLLPHGVRPNRSADRVRMAQYISMAPALEDDAALRDSRVRFWRDRIPPHEHEHHGSPRKKERELYGRAELTPLGERLLGLTSWS
ncbi:phytanoyl-CoA dioxygenase family protein [Streptomyces roseoverticillatus]|uniref:phytanoyl-CoA dioxygenase family protein n=1 Tax=Streptomyces roseoverticillatus TaxID=66429 RepID=UPI0004C20CE6|nr:phytanoyl-CoA dioxygenase family protein [Streptomyces roseoverticillatus]